MQLRSEFQMATGPFIHWLSCIKNWNAV